MRIIKLSLFAVIILLLFPRPQAALAVPVDLAISDAYFYDSSINTDPVISDGYEFDESRVDMYAWSFYNSLHSPPRMDKKDYRGVFEVDLTSIPVGSTINSVELIIWADPLGSTGVDAHLYSHTGDGELNIDDVIGSPWSQPDSLGTYESKIHGVPSTQPGLATFTISVDSVEQAINGTGYLGLQLVDLSLDSNYTATGFKFLSSEYSNETMQPKFTIDYDAPSTNPVPEPATIFLLGLGLAGLAGVGRKLKKQ